MMNGRYNNGKENRNKTANKGRVEDGTKNDFSNFLNKRPELFVEEL